MNAKNICSKLLTLFLLCVSCTKENIEPDEVLSLDLSTNRQKDMRKELADLYTVEEDLFTEQDMYTPDPYLYVRSLKPVVFKSPFPSLSCGCNCIKALINTDIVAVAEVSIDFSWTSGPCINSKNTVCEFVLKNSVVLDYK